MTFLMAPEQQLPEDVGKAGPIGLLLIVLLMIATALLVKSMTTHLKRIPPTFDDEDREPEVVVPDTPAELVEPPRKPEQDLLDTLRQAPLAIEPPRRTDDGRPETRGR